MNIINRYPRDPSATRLRGCAHVMWFVTLMSANHDVIQNDSSTTREWSSHAPTWLYVDIWLYMFATNSTFFHFLVGTYKLRDVSTLTAVIAAALSSGYRLIGKTLRLLHNWKQRYYKMSSQTDTASVYRNEETIGQALVDLCPNHGMSPDDIFLTSKLGMMSSTCSMFASSISIGYNIMSHWSCILKSVHL